MPSHIKELEKKGIAHPPHGLSDLIQYEVYMGSHAYGCPSESAASDLDVYGWAIPEKHIIFPHLNGHIWGFGPKPQGFESYSEHHLKDPSAMGGAGREYDYSIYSVIKFFDLLLVATPNLIDTLYVPDRCILFTTPLGMKVRDNRKIFLSQRIVHTFRGYAHQQLHKLRIKSPTASSKRRELVDKFGFDVKFAYHIVRLMEECRMLLEEESMDIERHREIYKAIRAGEWTLGQIEDYFKREEPRLLDLAEKSNLPKKPNADKIKELLLDVLERHFGSLKEAVTRQDSHSRAIQEIKEVLQKHELY